jgi:hypothetical protein
MHLATGRLIAQGEHQFGKDPFAFTTTGARWVNHSWLFDVVSYGLAQMLGGPDTSEGGGLLVVVKALVITVLAGLMLSFRRQSQSLWIGCGCTALAVLVMSPRLLLQPTCISFLFLGLTLFLLYRYGLDAEPQTEVANSSAWRLLVPLPFLFALWVNLDAWFLLGPLTVGLYTVGTLLERTVPLDRAAPPGRTAANPGPLFVVLGTGLAACLLNPFGIYAFDLPPELWVAVQGGEGLRRTLVDFTSPLTSDYLEGIWRYREAQNAAYLVLIAAGVASFELSRPSWRWWRAVIWLVFCLGGLFAMRLIPFFAVVAGPIMALNFQDYAARRFGNVPRVEKPWRTWSLAGRIGTIALALVLLAVAWPGWVVGGRWDARQSRRRVAWRIDPDLSLRQTALALGAWHEQGVLGPQSHGFNFDLDVANYLAWYSPNVKGFIDHRFPLFTATIEDWLKVRQALRPKNSDNTGPQDVEQAEADQQTWERVFRDPRYTIDYIVLSNPRRTVHGQTLRLWEDQEQWKLLYLDGRTMIFGWKDPVRGAVDPFQGHEYDANALAFGPKIPDSQRPPDQAPDAPQPQSAWQWYTNGLPPTPLAEDEAFAHLFHYELTARQWPYYYTVVQWLSCGADPGLTAAAGGGPVSAAFNVFALTRFHPVAYNQDAQSHAIRRDPLLPAEIALPERLFLPPNRLADQMISRGKERGLPADLLLAVRAARRAVAASPDDPDSYLLLAEAYQQLWTLQEGPWTEGVASMAQRLRSIQIVTALQHALTLRPDDPQIHLSLAQAYNQARTDFDPSVPFIDLEVEQWSEYLRYTRAAGRPAALPEDKYAEALEKLEKQVEKKESDLKRLQRDYEYELAQSGQTPNVYTKAILAARKGLAKRAVEEIKEGNPAEYGLPGQRLLVQLLLAMGQADAIQEHLSALDAWDRAQIGAALGDYRQADESLGELVRANEDGSALLILDGLRLQTFRPDVRPENFYQIVQILATFRKVADWRTVRGLMALEAGDTASATRHFRKAVDASYSPLPLTGALAPLATGSPLEPLALYPAGFLAGRGMGMYFPTQPLAYRYWHLLRDAGN